MEVNFGPYIGCQSSKCSFRATQILFTKKFVRISSVVHSLFLAAMSSSRSDIVTQSVRPFVRPFVPFFFLLVSLKFYPVLKSFKGVSRKSKGCLKLEGCLWKFQGCFKEVLRCLQKVSMEFQ